MPGPWGTEAVRQLGPGIAPPKFLFHWQFRFRFAFHCTEYFPELDFPFHQVLLRTDGRIITDGMSSLGGRRYHSVLRTAHNPCSTRWSDSRSGSAGIITHIIKEARDQIP